MYKKILGFILLGIPSVGFLIINIKLMGLKDTVFILSGAIIVTLMIVKGIFLIVS